MLQDDIQFFEDNFESLAEQYPGQAVLIKDGEVFGPFQNEREAYDEGIRRFGNVEFLVRTVDGDKQRVALPALTLGLIDARS